MLAMTWLLVALLLPATGGGTRHTIEIAQFRFAPSPLEVALGDTVVWHNRDIVPHTARADNGAWDSGDIPANGRRVVVMGRKGVQTYNCLYHSNMKAKLIVR